MADSGGHRPLPQIPQEQWQGEEAELTHSVWADNFEPTPPKPVFTVKRRALSTMSEEEPEARQQATPTSMVHVHTPSLSSFEDISAESNHSPVYLPTPNSTRRGDSEISLPFHNRQPSAQARIIDEASFSRTSSGSIPQIHENDEYLDDQENEAPQSEGLQYHAFADAWKKNQRMSQMTTRSADSESPELKGNNAQLGVPRTSTGAQRPTSTYSQAELRGRTLSPLSANSSDHGSGSPHARSRESSTRRAPGVRPKSYIGMLNNVPHSEQIAPGGPGLINQSLQSVIGSAASLLDTKRTIEMYRANVKKSNDPDTQYEFAILMVNTARDATPESGLNPAELITEAKHILQRLADRTYPFAQYYLGDGYFSGLFNKDKPDYDKAFPLFVAASKHGHAEAGYRAALCYEFGWGTTVSYPKAVQFYRNSASKNHPGAATRLGLACLRGEMALNPREKSKEGLKWLKRATDAADMQYNTAPYELGLLHLTGYGDDVFKDEAYAAQLFTQAAGLGHAEASYVMGQAYENALHGCPRDAALSVHFYNGAATRGHAEAMMALCAWYIVGAPPFLLRDDGEAYAWAMMAADTGFVKAEYAVGYFTEMGIGCRRDPLEANVWYVRAADQGDEKAIQRLQIIHAAASGHATIVGHADGKRQEKKKFMGIF